MDILSGLIIKRHINLVYVLPLSGSYALSLLQDFQCGLACLQCPPPYLFPKHSLPRRLLQMNWGAHCIRNLIVHLWTQCSLLLFAIRASHSGSLFAKFSTFIMYQGSQAGERGSKFCWRALATIFGLLSSNTREDRKLPPKSCDSSWDSPRKAKIRQIRNWLNWAEAVHLQLRHQISISRETWATIEEQLSNVTFDYNRLTNFRRSRASDTNYKRKPTRGCAFNFCGAFLSHRRRYGENKGYVSTSKFYSLSYSTWRHSLFLCIFEPHLSKLCSLIFVKSRSSFFFVSFVSYFFTNQQTKCILFHIFFSMLAFFPSSIFF